MNDEFVFDLTRGFFKTQPGDRRIPVSPSIDLGNLPGFVRALLTNDGTVTRYFESYLWEPVQVVVLSTDETEERLLRSVLLRTSSTVLAAAETYLPFASLDSELRVELAGARRGIGQVVDQLQYDTHRRISSVVRIEAGTFATALELEPDDPVLVREYQIFRSRKAFATIREVFPEERLLRLAGMQRSSPTESSSDV